MELQEALVHHAGVPAYGALWDYARDKESILGGSFLELTGR
jgi:hypothetical protein